MASLGDLPAEILWRILEHCHPIDYDHFVNASRVMHLDSEHRLAQRRRKAHELTELTIRFIHDYIYWINNQILIALFGTCKTTHFHTLSRAKLYDFEVISAFFTRRLYRFSKLHPLLVSEDYYTFYQRGGKDFTFPDRDRVHQFLRFCQSEGEEFRRVQRVVANYNVVALWRLIHF